MSGLCDRCNERTSYIVNIAHLPELVAVEHLGYRMVCSPCYDDLLAEASETEDTDEDRYAKVNIKATVEGNTSHLEPFFEEMTIEEISLAGLRLHTTRELEPGTVLKVSVPSYDFDVAAIVETVWREAQGRSVILKLVEPSKGWERLWDENGAE
ncbi:MAG: hypothetical protein WBV94_32310 [Blastocatellia bacterium]